MTPRSRPWTPGRLLVCSPPNHPLLDPGGDSIINQFPSGERGPAEGGNERWQAWDIGKHSPAGADEREREHERERQRRFIWRAAGAEGNGPVCSHLGAEAGGNAEYYAVESLGGSVPACTWALGPFIS